MSYTIIRPTNHDAWLEQRKQGIGSSEVGTILGVNPFDTPYKLWRRKKGLDAPIEENFAMKAGHYLEDAVSQFYQDESGNQIIKASQGDWICVNDEKPYLQVSPDRTFWLPNKPHTRQNKGICECKTTQRSIDADNVPMYWFCQLQYQLQIHELDFGAIAWLTQGREFGFRNYNRDAEFCEWMISEIDKFWTDYIVGNQEPDAIDVSDVLLKYPQQTDGKTIELNQPIFDAYNHLKEVKEQIKDLTTKKDELESVIKIAMGDAEQAKFDGQTIATWRTPSKPSVKFDENRFKSENAAMYANYLHEVIGGRRFTLK